jgi:hypothetical protein
MSEIEQLKEEVGAVSFRPKTEKYHEIETDIERVK